MYTTLFFAAGLLGLAQAQSYTPPKAQTFGSLYTPDVSHPVTQGQTFSVTWDPKGHTTDGSTVSLVLCRGGSGNCVTDPTAIVSGIPAVNAQYTWAVPCSLPVGVQATDSGYGMLIIVDGTGEFQYSTQFSVKAGASCGSSSSSSSSSTTTPSSTPTSSTLSSTTKKSSTTTADASSSWTAWAGYNSTTSHTTSHYISTTQKATTPATQTMPLTTIKISTTTPVAAASASVFTGAASQIGGSAAALVVAAGAAFFAL